MGYDVFELALRVGGYETYCRRGKGIKGMWQEDFPWLEPFFVDYMLFGGDNEPDRVRRITIHIISAIFGVGKKVFGGGGGFLDPRFGCKVF